MTKLALLKSVTEEQILKHYFPDFTSLGKNYKNPFTPKDNKPSLSFFKSGKVIKFKAHNSDHHGDIFQFIGYLKSIDCKSNFTGLLEAIARDMQLNGYAVPTVEKRAIPVAAATAPVIAFEETFSKEFLAYFKQFKIDQATLDKFQVKQVIKHSFLSKSNKLCTFDYKRQKKLVACYTIDGRIKLYQPEIPGRQPKTFGYKNQTAADVFGLAQLTKCKNLYLAAGEKDCLALNANGLTSVAFQSETLIPSSSVVTVLRSLAENIFIIYDNDAAGKEGAKKIQETYGFPIVSLPAGIKDAADYFKKFDASQFEESISITMPKEKKEKTDEDPETDQKEFWTIFHQAEKYLSAHYEIRFNTISLEHECKRLGAGNFQPLNENNLYVEMNKAGVKIGIDKLVSILKSDFIPHFNPFKVYFENLPEWEGNRDYIGELASHIKVDNAAEFLLQFTKWLVRAVKCALVPGYYNKQAFILVHSKQNSGKSTFCRYLCPPALSNYIAENISDDKDSKIAIAKNFLINLDELSSLAKHEINSLKALFSKDIINERLPYDRKNSIIHRVASFLGSTNMTTFLTDETGSVRWLCFEIHKIDWKYKEAINIDNVWAQAYGMYLEAYDCELSAEDIRKNEIRNSKFQQLSAEAEMIPDYLKPASEAAGVFCTATDILMYLTSFTTLRLNKVMVGKALLQNGFKRVKESQTDRYGYYVNKLK